MFVQSTLLFPDIGKGPELRSLLEERTRQQQSQGQRVALSTIIFGPNTPAFRVARQFDDLGRLEAFRQQPVQPDPRVPATFRQPVTNALWEVLLPAQTSSETPHYTQRTVLRPLPGKAPELINLLTEFARGRQAEGQRTSAGVQVAGPAAGALLFQTVFGSLLELEKARGANRANSGVQQMVAKLAGLVAAPANTAISEIVVPFAPR